LLREFIGRESIDDRGFIGRELFEAAPIPRLPKSPPALEGRGTDRAPMAPFCGPLELLNAGPRLPPTELLNPAPRLPAPMVGRCCDAPKVERCIPPVCPGLDTSAALAWRPFALNEPRLPARAPELKEPRFAALFPARIPALSDPRFPAASRTAHHRARKSVLRRDRCPGSPRSKYAGPCRRNSGRMNCAYSRQLVRRNPNAISRN